MDRACFVMGSVAREGSFKGTRMEVGVNKDWAEVK